MSTFEYIIYTREKNKTLLEVKKGLLKIETYNEWNANYFAKRQRYKSKIIIEKKEAVLNGTNNN